jgi:outer membrane protein OmpA-like peptidoglycan-associated protein
MKGIKKAAFVVGIVFFLLRSMLIAQEDTLDIPDIIDVGKAEFSIIEIQWAHKVVSFSSEMGTVQRSAKQILGKPNVMPGGGSSPCAWAIKKKNSEGIEFIRVAFEKPSRPKQLAVAENFRAGCIEKITLYGVNRGEERVVYEATAAILAEPTRFMNLFFEEIPFDVVEAEIRLNSKKVSDFEIDAIGISSSDDTIKAMINIPANVKYLADKESLGPNINTPYDEKAPVISADGKELYFVRKFHPSNIGKEKDEDDIWYSKHDGKSWSFAINIDKPLNTIHHNYVQSISPDGNELLLANVYVKNGYQVDTRAGVSVSYKTKTGWSFPVEQKIKDFRNNSPYANYYLSANGKYLLMAIEMDDTYGGLDLYVSFKTAENAWSKPINLGPDVNTAANDYSPFMAADGRTLYYSTAGISGYGKEDVFVTRRIDDTWQKWSEPMNMGKPINSTESDTKFSIPASGSYAYFSSDKGSVGQNDIFRILLPDTVKPIAVALLKGKIIDMTTKDPIGGAIIIYKNYPEEVITVQELSDTLTGAFSLYLPVGHNYTAIVKARGYVDGRQMLDLSSIYNFTIIEQQPIQLMAKQKYRTITGQLNDQLTDKMVANAKVAVTTDAEGKNVIAFTYTDENGAFEVKVENIYDDEQLYLSIEKENYEQIILTIDENYYETDIPLDLNLEPEIKQDKVIEFHNIYFDFGSSDVKDTAKTVLDRIAAFMNEKPTIEIELSGHTDSKSGDAFNKQLSQKRADNAKEYLVSKGIVTERIQAVGYGESRLLNDCKDGVECSEEEHAINRRIEVKIIKM